MPAEEKKRRGLLVQQLRKRLKLSHAQIGEAGGFLREKMSKFESGANALTTVEALEELARGFGVPPDVLRRYLEEEISVEAVTDARRGVLRVAEPVVEYGTRYSALKRVLARPSHVGRWSPAAIAAARSLQLDADFDPDERWWTEALDRLDAAIKVSLPRASGRQPDPLADIDDVRPARKK